MAGSVGRAIDGLAFALSDDEGKGALISDFVHGRGDRARRRVLDVTAALFNAEGIREVDLERVAAESGVPERVVRRHFASKDDLVYAYLLDQDVRIRYATAPCDIAPEAQLVRLFDVVGELSGGPGHRAVFINAAAEYPDATHPVRRVITAHRRWFRELLRDLLVAARHPDVDLAADMLMLLRDGLFIRGELDDRTANRDLARAAVLRVLDFPDRSR